MSKTAEIIVVNEGDYYYCCTSGSGDNVFKSDSETSAKIESGEISARGAFGSGAFNDAHNNECYRLPVGAAFVTVHSVDHVFASVAEAIEVVREWESADND